jgi:predicted nucleic acid-binding protein
MKRLIVLDANILVRAVLGNQVSSLINTYVKRIGFVTVAPCYAEVRKHLPTILEKRRLPLEPFLAAVDTLTEVVLPIEEDVYGEYEVEARKRIQERDVNDWPLIALSLALNCPIWTEDNDFFGTGVATWRTKNVEIYLSGEY